MKDEGMFGIGFFLGAFVVLFLLLYVLNLSTPANVCENYALISGVETRMNKGECEFLFDGVFVPQDNYFEFLRGELWNG